MIRRRRRPREIPFSFDSFLDIVANVVGIIIRLILVVWVGARSYSSVMTGIEHPPAPQVVAALPEPTDPLSQELAAHRRELALAHERLLAQMRQLQEIDQEQKQTQEEWSALVSRGEKLSQEQSALDQAAHEQDQIIQTATLSSAELRERSRKLAEELHELEQTPLPKKTLHYHTPVSKPVHSEELLFECNENRVAFIDVGALLGMARQNIIDKEKLLRNQWDVHDITPTVGAFRLRYTFERERDILDGLGSKMAPDPNVNFRYSLSAWQVESITFERGETLRQALTPGSEFRQVVDGIEPRETTVTLWVYPDSFDLFRQLRDFLYERDIIVAGRPLPRGVPIASSRRGSVSRGQ
jgi:hypothetical protein